MMIPVGVLMMKWSKRSGVHAYAHKSVLLVLQLSLDMLSKTSQVLLLLYAVEIWACGLILYTLAICRILPFLE